MGGRGRAESGGAMVKAIGIGYLDFATGEITMLKGMHRTVHDALPVGAAISSVKSGLKDAGIKGVSNKDAQTLASALAGVGALVGFKGSMRNKLYKAARLMGDVGAATKGPTAIYSRIKRRLTGRLTGKLFKKLF